MSKPKAKQKPALPELGPQRRERLRRENYEANGMEYKPRLSAAQKAFLEEHQVLSAAQVAELMGTTRFTIGRWRVCGFLPAPTQCGVMGYAWLASSLSRWILAGYPYANRRAAQVAVRNSPDLAEFLAPPAASETTRAVEAKPQIAKELDALERAMDDREMYTVLRPDGEAPPPLPTSKRVLFLVGRLQELAKEAKKLERRAERDAQRAFEREEARLQQEREAAWRKRAEEKCREWEAWSGEGEDEDEASSADDTPVSE